MTTIERFRHAARRVGQTLTDFENGPRLLGAIASRPITGRPDELVFRVDDQLSVICPNRPGARVPVYEVFAEDTYRLGWFTSDLGDSPVAVDIGAHIGCFSLAFARQHPEGQVEAFEASPSTAVYLERNVDRNGFSGRVHCHQVAVASKTGTLIFADNVGGSSLNGITAPEGAKQIEVPCMTVADAFASAVAGVEVVKIDTEGAEYDMVLNSASEDWASVRRVVMEYHDVPGHSWPELEAFFGTVGLSTVAHEPVSPRQGTVWLSRDELA
ncbi:MAG: FkbM family methyltransferase [Aeromicrobium sp.]